MLKSSTSKSQESSPASQPKGSNGAREMDDPEKTMATVARFIEQLQANKSSAMEKELITARVLGIARARKQARALIGSHTHAILLLLSILRNGTLMAKVNVTATLIVLCKDDELRLKVLLGGCIPPLLSLLKSDSNEARKAAAEAIYEVSPGGLSDDHEEYEDTEGIWISALLLAILFVDGSVVSSPSTMRTIPSLALLLKSDEIMDRYCAAHAMTNLVSKGNKGISLAIANSGAVADLISLIGQMESDLPNLVALSKEFNLAPDPGQVVLECLFEIEDVKVGPTAQKSIPLLLDILRPVPDRLAAPPFAVELLTRIADGSNANKLTMSAAGALEALAKYLSLSPLDTTETTVAELLRILFSNCKYTNSRRGFMHTNLYRVDLVYRVSNRS